MKNSLVKQYKKSVNDDSMLKFGELRFKVTESSASGITISVAATGSPVMLTILTNNVNFYDLNNQPLNINHYTLLADGIVRFLKVREACEISIDDKYSLSYFSCSPCGANLDNFEYSKVTELNLGNIPVTDTVVGNISKLSQSTTKFVVSSSNITLDWSKATLPNIKEFTFNFGKEVEIYDIVHSMPNIEIIGSFYGCLTGTIASLGVNTKIKKIICEQRGSKRNLLAGDITDFTGWTALETLNLSDVYHVDGVFDATLANSLTSLKTVKLTTATHYTQAAKDIILARDGGSWTGGTLDS
jgi:hypothetical protein